MVKSIKVIRMMIKVMVLEGDFCVIDVKFVIVVVCFNSFVVESLLSGVLDVLVWYGVSEINIEIICVFGVFEMFLVVK